MAVALNVETGLSTFIKMNSNSGQFKSQQELERKASVIILEFE